MLSYRHAYHAGNHADVLKHMVLIEILMYLNKKAKPYFYIDTHAGAGMYDLTSAASHKILEFRDGIERVLIQDFPELETYLSVIKRFNDGGLACYPGSPLIAQHVLREQDRARVHELHPTDFLKLNHVMKNDVRFQVLNIDGYQGLLKALPPVSRRGMVLIDPSYEIKTEYQTMIDAVVKAHKKFATGVYAIWYPVVERARINEIDQQWVSSGIKNIQRFELSVTADSELYGMTGSGMWIINPPWSLKDKMEQILPQLKRVLAQDESAFTRCDILVGE